MQMCLLKFIMGYFFKKPMIMLTWAVSQTGQASTKRGRKTPTLISLIPYHNDEYEMTKYLRHFKKPTTFKKIHPGSHSGSGISGVSRKYVCNYCATLDRRSLIGVINWRTTRKRFRSMQTFLGFWSVKIWVNDIHFEAWNLPFVTAAIWLAERPVVLSTDWLFFVDTLLSYWAPSPTARRWCSGIMQDSHSCDPGSILGRRTRFANVWSGEMPIS